MALLLSLFLTIALLLDRTASAYALAFTPIDVEGAESTFARGIDDVGSIVGTSYTPGSRRSGFVLTEGVFSFLNVPEPYFTHPLDINSTGDIVGIISGDGPGFYYSGGVFTTVQVPEARRTFVYGINDSGDIVGSYNDINGRLHGFILSNAGIQIIDVAEASPPGSHITGINNFGDVVGRAGFEIANQAYSRGFVIPHDTTIPLFLNIPFNPGDLNNNDHGDIVGTYFPGKSHGFVLSGGILFDIFIPGSVYTEARGINNLGQIVGTYQTPDGRYHGFLTSIDNLPTAVPEPVPESSTWLLLATGLLILGGYGWRIRRSA